ncbi:MAG: SdpI family protein [Gemmatimonadaceae bacterium]
MTGARLIPALAGVLYLVMGRAIPRARTDSWFGVRTPWTLSNDVVWARTQRLAGVSMTSAGVAMILGALALPADLVVPLSLGAGMAAIVAPAVYSYLTWRRERRG